MLNIILNIMLKNKKSAQYIILISYIQVCINTTYIYDKFRKTIILECIMDPID